MPTVIKTIEFCIKHVGVVLYAYMFFLIAMPEKQNRSRCLAGGLAAVLLGIAAVLVMNYIISFYVIAIMMLFFMIMGMMFRLSPQRNLTLTLISFGFSYAAYYIAVAVSLIYLNLNALVIQDRFSSFDKAVDYLCYIVIDTPRSIINQIVVTLTQGVMLLLVLRTKRVKKGISTLVRFGMSDVGVYISIFAISIKLFHVLAVNGNSEQLVTLFACYLLSMVCIFMLYFWIKNELKSAYISKMRQNEIDLLEKSLEESKKTNRQLIADNERLAEIIHKDNKLIPSMVMTVRQAAEGMANGTDASGSIAKALEAADSLDEIYASRGKALAEYETHGSPLPQTGVTAVDAVLLYMQSKAESCGVEFKVNIETGLPEMLNEVIDRREFNTMLADLSENAIISARTSREASVAVRIGREGERYFLAVSDNGGRFDVEVLKSMGKKPVTTHSAEGGSGIGMMTLFKILRHTGASFCIEELPGGEAKEPYTKDLRVTFDGAGRLRIVTDRADELRKALRTGRFEVVRNSKPC